MKYILIINLLLEVLLTTSIPIVKGYFYNQLALYSTMIYLSLFLYLGVLFLLDLIQNNKPLLITYVANQKRKLLTNHYLNKYVNGVVNREQRIQEDIKLHATNHISVRSEYLISALIVILLIIQNYNYPLLIIASLAYSGLCILSAFLFKGSMIKTEKEIQQTETDFRNHIRENTWTDNIVFDVLRINILNAWVKFKYGICVRIQNSLVIILPILYLIPSYLQHTVSLGLMMEQSTIFSLLVVNISIIVNLFPQLMQSKASRERFEELNLE